MLAGTVIADSDQRLFVVLESRAGQVAVAPIRPCRVRGEKRYAGDVPVIIGILGSTIVQCGCASVMTERFSNTGIAIQPADLAACQSAAVRVAKERKMVKVKSSIVASVMPSFRSGGRRVGPIQVA